MPRRSIINRPEFGGFPLQHTRTCAEHRMYCRVYFTCCNSYPPFPRLPSATQLFRGHMSHPHKGLSAPCWPDMPTLHGQAPWSPRKTKRRVEWEPHDPDPVTLWVEWEQVVWEHFLAPFRTLGDSKTAP